VNKERLLKLAKYLNSLKITPEVKYDQNNWGVMNFKPSELKVGPKCEVKEGFCKTSACALGHAALMPEFQRLGLHVEWREGYSTNGTRTYNASIRLKGSDETDEFRVGAKFFGLSEHQAHIIFGSGSMNSKEKAAQIRKMVNAAK
jgi:hypothetical protein